MSHSSATIGISRRTAYDWRKRYADFAAEWDEAVETSVDELEAEARRRAFSGVEEPVFYKGEECGAIRKYSDKLLELLLKAHRPEKYRENIKLTISDADEAINKSGAPLPETFHGEPLHSDESK